MGDYPTGTNPDRTSVLRTLRRPAQADRLAAAGLASGRLPDHHDTTSPAKTVTLTNSGTAPLTINSIGITGANPGDFAQTST
ncbi:MAG: hypothetical protein LC799_15045, partial [Actinobacteria bacterium]|nr:hypothetical protein [Actinomycetota bacterium]